jgi:glycerol-3-phosphate acyltransferase PlsY
MTGIIAAAAIGYLLGAIPFGLMLTRLAGYGDVRQIGSGNIGATNVLRTGSKSLAALTLVFDTAKGTAAALIGAQWGANAMLAASAAVVIGHMFPVWLGFRGGKGLATAFGVVIVIAWPVAVLGGTVWLAVAILSRYSSLAALVAMAAAAIYAGFALPAARAALIAAIVVVIVMRHHENIRRLIAGTESRVSLKKS